MKKLLKTIKNKIKKPGKVTTTENVTKLTIENTTEGVTTYTLFDKESDNLIVVALDDPYEADADDEAYIKEDLQKIKDKVHEWMNDYPGIRIAVLPVDTNQLSRYQVNKIKQFNLL